MNDRRGLTRKDGGPSAASAVGLILLVSCGGGWTGLDATGVKDEANQSYQLEVLCGRAPDDAGTCSAATVRAIERANYCTVASMAYRHGIAVVDAGIACQAP